MIQVSFSFLAMAKYLYVLQSECNEELNLIFILFSPFSSFPLSLLRWQCNGGQKPKLFGYNVVFEPGASQNDVLEYSGIKRIIEMAIEGFSCTAFCYGQTGSGKTHTLTGPPELVISISVFLHWIECTFIRCYFLHFQFEVHWQTRAEWFTSRPSVSCISLSLPIVTRT